MPVFEQASSGHTICVKSDCQSLIFASRLFKCVPVALLKGREFMRWGELWFVHFDGVWCAWFV